MPSEEPKKKTARTGDLPPEILVQVNELLVDGKSGEEIRGFLAALGYDFEKTVFGRYGADFLENYRRLKIVEEKSRALSADEENELVIEEAASRAFAWMIVEAQLDGKIDLKSLPRLLADFARLQSSNVQREKLRREWKAKAEKAAQEVEKSARRGGLSDETARQIRLKILGLAE